MERSLIAYPFATGELTGSIPFTDMRPAVIDLLDNQAHWMLIRPREFAPNDEHGRYWSHLTIAEIEERADAQMLTALDLNDSLNRLASEYGEVENVQ